jgi:multisubunit Na+/H+ antiporter MnhE subunit
MLHAAAMLAGLFVLGLLITQGWSSRDEAVRKSPFSTAPQFLLLIFSRSGAVLHGALSTIRAALAADVRLKPALVRVRSEAIGAAAKAAAADLISAAPGSIVVETDSEGTLVHVMNEDAADSSVFAAVQSRAAALLGARL